MRTAIGFFVLILALGVFEPASVRAKDVSKPALGATRLVELPFPRSERAQRIWDSRACWSDCGRTCAWGFNACLKQDSQAECLAWTDGCDRSCQRQCRDGGGPFSPFD